MSFTLRAKRTLVGALAMTMVISLMPAGVASADEHGEVCDNAGDAGFTDTSASVHEDNINCMFAYGIGSGYDDDTFRPGNPITRDQMATLLASFAVVANEDLDIPDVDVPFTDIEGNVHAANIEALYALGVVSGQTETTYNPRGLVTRAQYATFVVQAHEALGVDFDVLLDEVDSPFTDIAGDTHEANIEILYSADLVVGQTATTYNPAGSVERGQVMTVLKNSAEILDANDLWDAPRLDPPAEPIGPNLTVTDNPELVEVERDGDIVTFRFDQNIPGKALDFFNTDGEVGSLASGDEVDYYTGLRLYNVAGTAVYPQEAGIFGDEVRARFASSTEVAAAVRAGVYEDTVQNAAGRSNPASSFALRPTAEDPDVIPPYYPQLTDVSNLRTTDVTPAEILVDFTFTFASATSAAANLSAIGTWLGEDDANSTTLADDFVVVGSAGQIFRGEDFFDAERNGANVTVTMTMDDAIEDLPVSQLRRGFVEEDAFLDAGLAHVLLSTAWGTIAEVNGTTSDPDLREVNPGPGANQMSFVFDEAVSVPEDSILDNPELYTVVNSAEERATATSIGRSLRPVDNATVMIATFDDTVISNYLTGDELVTDWLDTVTAATVDANWFDADRTIVSSSAARATNQVGSQQLGWATPAQVLVTPVQPDVPADPTPGVTALPDLTSVTKSQNAVTGNWSVTFTFNQSSAAEGTRVDFGLYDPEGVRFGPRDVVFTGSTYTFGPDAEGATARFTNEQIEAAVLGTVQDSDADLESVGGTDPDVFQEPRITEGFDTLD